MSGRRPWDPADDEGIGREIAAAAPDDDVDDALGLAAFLATMGLSAPPVCIGEFEIERRIGRGGFGTVYAAVQPGLGRRVAIKLLHPHRVAHADWLLREAKALAQFSHPHVVQVYQAGRSPRGLFIAMELVDGPVLRDWQVGKSWQDVLGAYAQAGEGLAEAHARGILHLDFKPTNALMGPDGRVRVADFGLAGGPGLGSTSGPLTRESESSERVHTRAIGGTSAYASPEQAGRGKVDARSDQFSLCVSLYEALHGALPFADGEVRDGSDPRRVWPLGPDDLGVPRWVDVVIRRGLAGTPNARWPSMRALLDALRRPPWYRRSRSFAMLAATIVVVPAIAAQAIERDDGCTATVQELGLDWSGERRREIEAAIRDGDAPYREVLADTVGTELDRWASDWVDSARAVCAAAHGRTPTPPEVHVRQRECLRRQSARFESVVGMIGERTVDAIENADALASELASPSSCESAPSTASEPTSMEPRVAELVAEIDRVRLDVAAGHLDGATERAAHALALAEDTGDTAVRAEALLVRGLVADALADDEAALLDLDEAAALAIEAGHDDLAAESWRRASWIAAVELEDLARAARWSRLGAAAVRRLEEPPRMHADQLDVEGTIARLSGDATTSESRHRAALVQLERVLEPDDPRWIDTWLSLAHALLELERIDESKRLYTRALDLATARLGRDHPQIARVLISRGKAVGRAAAPDELQPAFDDLGRADRILSAAQGSHTAAIARCRAIRAEIAMLLGRFDDAVDLVDSSLALQEEGPPVHVTERGAALSVLAQVEVMRGDLPAALAAHERYAAVRAPYADAEELSSTDNNIAWLLCRLDRCTEARAYYERILERGYAPLRAHAEAGLGHVAQAANRPLEARAHLENALAIAGTSDEPAPDLVAEIEWHLAQARAASGEPAAEILPLVERSLAYYRDSGTDDLALEELKALHESLIRDGNLPRTRGTPPRPTPNTQEIPWPPSSSPTQATPRRP